MVTEIAEYISAVLSHQAVKDVIGEDVFWIIAEESTEAPFLLFNFTAGAPMTKDSDRREYDLELTPVGKTLDEAAQLASDLKAAIKSTGERWIDNGVGKPQYYDDTFTTAIVPIKYKLKR